MADVSIIVDKNGTEFSIADTAARAEIAEITDNVGNLENLTTTAKNNVVAAVNELNAKSNVSAEWSQTVQGISVRARKSDHLVMILIYGTYTGAAVQKIPSLLTLPENLRPLLAARTALMNNTTDIPQGQAIVYEDGRLGLFGGTAKISPNVNYACSVCYIVA